MKDGSMLCEIGAARVEEWEDAMDLAWRTFLRFEAMDYTQEGIQSFENFISDTLLYKMFLTGNYLLFVARQKDRIVGLISLRKGSHISLLFVEENYHRRGIGRSLIRYVANYLRAQTYFGKVEEQMITVNAAPFAVEFYHKMGFVDNGVEVEKEGIRYTPMEKNVMDE